MMNRVRMSNRASEITPPRGPGIPLLPHTDFNMTKADHPVITLATPS